MLFRPFDFCSAKECNRLKIKTLKNTRDILSILRFPLLFAVVFLFTTQSVWATIKSYTPSDTTYLKNTYYSGANDQSGSALFSALSTIAGGVHYTYSKLTYDELWTAYVTSDVYPSGHAHAGTIWDMYANCYYSTSAHVTEAKAECNGGYNREHSMPKSWFGGSNNYSSTNQGCDLVHLVPTDAYVNSDRSNYAFGEVGTVAKQFEISKRGTSVATLSLTSGSTVAGTSVTTGSPTVFEPADEYKGDFARIYMYMRVRYPSLNLAQADGGTVHFSTTTSAASAEYYGLKKYSVILLMKWHRQDPVSQKEIDRNNQIEKMQGNRNPFVDYPCLAEYLWGSKAGQTFNTSNVIGSFQSGFVKTGDGCDGCSTSCSGGGGGTTTNYTITWMVNGSQWATTTSSGSSVGSLPNAPTSTSCGGKVFVGWSTTNIGSTESAAPSPLFTTASGAPTITADVTFYAVFATEGSGGGVAATVTFKSVDSDGTTDISSSISGQESSASGISSYSGTKVYAGTYGLKLGSSSVTGSVTCTLSSAITTSSITVDAKQYGSDNTTLGVRVNDDTDFVGSYSPSSTGGELTFTNSTAVSVSSVTVYATGKRAYVKTISVGGGSSYSGYVTSCTACTPTDPTASFDNPTTSVYVGASVTNTVTTESDGAVTYSSSNTSVASVDASTGQVTGVAAGSATITASIAASTCYTAKTVSYTITVTTVPTCTITWSVDGTPSSTTLNVGAALSVPTVNNCTGGTRVFKGWTTNSNYTSEDGSGLVTPTSPVAGDATYYAVYADETAGTGTETTTYNKVTSTPSSWAGEYLLVYESSNTAGVAWTGADTANCNTAVTIASGVISTKPSNAVTITVASMTGGYSIMVNGGTNNGKYIGRSADSNGMDWGTSAVANTFAYDGTNSCVTITGAGNAVLRYNSAKDNYRFRYFKSTSYTNQKVIQLYKKTVTVSGGTATTYDNYSTHCSDTPTTYTITWKDGDGNTLKTEEVAAGSTPSYTGTTPTKTATAQYTYTFNNTWSPSIVSVTEPATYTAQFSSTLRQYNILWKNEDGTSTLETDANQNYGTATAFNGSTPTKAATAQYTYTFDGWATEANGAKVYNNGSTPTVSGTATYYAHFSSTVNSYSVTFKDNFGTTLKTQTVNYGSAATAPSIPEINCYTHGTWDKAYNNITGDLTVTVNYTIIPYTVTAVPDNNSHGSTSITEQ